VGNEKWPRFEIDSWLVVVCHGFYSAPSFLLLSLGGAFNWGWSLNFSQCKKYWMRTGLGEKERVEIYDGEKSS